MSFYAKALIGLFIFWLVYSVSVSAMLADIEDTQFTPDDYTYPDIAQHNISVDAINTGNPTPWGIWSAMSKMLTFRLASDDMPWIMGVFISGFNWLLVLSMLLCIYRVLLPTA